MRILVTGSRHWTDRGMIWDALNKASFEIGTTIVHGDCPTGADYWAKLWTKTQPDVIEEAYPANWKKFGKLAGPIRNQQMVDLGADICLAFPLPSSRGTYDCIRKAKAAGIPVRIYHADAR